jgi:hypothetical protein
MTSPIGRKIKCGTEQGTIALWEPLGTGLCDTLVTLDTGKQVWFAMHSLRPTDGQGALPDRREARETARLQAITDVQACIDDHIRDFRKPWPGCEFAKTWIGNAFIAARDQLKGERP